MISTQQRTRPGPKLVIPYETTLKAAELLQHNKWEYVSTLLGVDRGTLRLALKRHGLLPNKTKEHS